jgi:hypothetical protein
MNEFAIGGVPTSTLETAAREAAEYASLDALGEHVGQSRAQLLAASELGWDGKRIGGDLQCVQGVAVLLAQSRALSVLDLRSNALGAEGARILAAALEGNTTLATLGLGTNQIGDVGAAALAQVLPSMTGLTQLYLSSNQIGDAVQAQLEAARGPKLEYLIM